MAGDSHFRECTYLSRMRRTAFEPRLPTPGKQVPAGPAWLHEIKHDGYRLMVQREGKRVRLFTRNGHDWTDRYPLIVEAALKNRSRSFVIDGEAVLLGVEEGWLSAFRLSPMPSRERSARRSCGCLRRGTGGWRWGLVDCRRSQYSARSGITRNVRSVPRSPREYSNRQHDYSDNGERSKVHAALRVS
jgi:bifunctional non-homologous end joining protein LigD